MIASGTNVAGEPRRARNDEEQKKKRRKRAGLGVLNICDWFWYHFCSGLHDNSPVLNNIMQVQAECHVKKRLAPIEMLAELRNPIRKSFNDGRNDSTCIMLFSTGWRKTITPRHIPAAPIAAFGGGRGLRRDRQWLA
jgi:hypothetical protein